MILDKKQMSEEDVKLQFITPAIVSKWTLDRITTETKVTDGQINLKERSSMNAEIDRVLAEITERLGGAK